MNLEMIILSEASPTKINIIWYHFYVEPKKKMIQEDHSGSLVKEETLGGATAGTGGA